METKHIIPVGGPEPLHVASGSCWCHPAPDTAATGILVHNANDCREKWERQGLRPENDSAWVTIIEAAQAPTAAEIAGTKHLDVVLRLVRRFKDAARSAASKEYVSELTEEEACAICLFAGVRYEIDFETGRMTFNPCGLYKHHGEWTVILPPNCQ